MLSRAALVLPLALLACNKAPEGLSIALGPDGATTADDIVIDVLSEAVDPNKNDEVMLDTTWYLDGVVVDDLAGAVAVPAARTEAGQSWKVEVAATDGRKLGELLEDTLIVANTPPVAELSIAKGQVLTHESLEASVVTTDIDGDEVEVVWAWTVDGVDADIDSGTVPAERTAKGQVWRVSATPTDTYSSGEPVTGEITVGNTVPSVGAARIDPGLAYETSVLSCLGGAWRDADEDPETYEVRWYVNGGMVSEQANLDGADFDRGDSVSCALTPVDDESSGDTVRSGTIDVRNSKAFPTGVTLVPESATVESTLEAEVSSIYDADGDFAVAMYEWFIDGESAEHTASFFRPWEHGAVKGDEIKVWVRGYDGVEPGEGPARTVVLGNAPPAAPAVKVVSTGMELHCQITAESTDADGDSVTYGFTWEVDGVAWTGATKSIEYTDDAVPAGSIDEGETWRCTVTPDDGDDPGPSATADIGL